LDYSSTPPKAKETFRNLRLAGTAFDSANNQRAVAIDFNPRTGKAIRINVSVSGQELPKPHQGVALQEYYNDTVGVPSDPNYPYHTAGLIMKPMIREDHLRAVSIYDPRREGTNPADLRLHTYGFLTAERLPGVASRTTQDFVTLSFNPPNDRQGLNSWKINIPTTLQMI